MTLNGKKLVNCRSCFNLIIITEYGDFERKCTEGLETGYEDRHCEKYVAVT